MKAAIQYLKDNKQIGFAKRANTILIICFLIAACHTKPTETTLNGQARHKFQYPIIGYRFSIDSIFDNSDSINDDLLHITTRDTTNGEAIFTVKSFLDTAQIASINSYLREDTLVIKFHKKITTPNLLQTKKALYTYQIFFTDALTYKRRPVKVEIIESGK